MAEGVTVANAYVQIMPSAEGAKEAITGAVLPGMEDLGAQAGEGITGGLLTTLKGMAGPIAGVLAGLGIGKALLDIGGSFDEMRDSIIIGTGASGEALEELVGIAQDVATTVPVSFGQAGDYIQDLNTRLGLTGDDLRDVATQLGALDSMIGGVNVETLSGAFAAWGIAAEDMSGQMDYLFTVSQNTGLGFDELTSILEKNAPAMQQLGFSFEETANMAGLLDRAGMDAQGMLTKMNRAFTEIAAEGGDAGEAFEQMIGEMQGYIEAGDTAAAMDIATQLFGTKGAAQFLQAVEDGTIDMQQFQDAALGAGEGIMGTYDATASWTESLEVLKNKAAVAIEPLASFAFDALGAGIDTLTAAFDEMAPVVEPLIDTLGAVLTDTVLPGVQTAIETLSPVIEDLGAGFAAVAGFVTESVASIAETVVPTFNTIAETVVQVWEGIKTTIEGVVGFVTSLVEGDFEGMAESLSGIWDGIKSTASSVWEGIKSVASTVWDGIKSAIEGPINKAKDIVKNAIDKIKGFFSFEFKWPHIPLPHFSITGSLNPLDWLSGGLPSIGVEWYAKGGIVDGATLIGAGEKGPEAIIPLYEPYFSKWGDMIAERMDVGGGVTNNYYIDGNLVAADAALAAALDTVAQRVGGRRRMGVA